MSPTDCSKGEHGPIGSWDVSAVTDMRFLFVDKNYKLVPGADKFNVDISKWDVSRVTNMKHMFFKATSFNSDISKWVVSKVANMLGMFGHAASFNGDLSKWDVSSVTNMKYMFKGATSFAQTLCGTRWTKSKADKQDMFVSSKGKIGSTSSGCGTCKQ